MRILSALAALSFAAALSACVYVERDRPAPARPATVRTVPPGGAAVVTPDPVPAAPPSAVIVR